MTWINPLDKVPQIPQDWANHISYGGIGTIALIAAQIVVLIILGAPFSKEMVYLSTLHAALAMTIVSSGKKIVDFVKVGPPTESAKICICKAIVTLLWPVSLAYLAYLLH